MRVETREGLGVQGQWRPEAGKERWMDLFRAALLSGGLRCAPTSPDRCGLVWASEVLWDQEQ